MATKQTELVTKWLDGRLSDAELEQSIGREELLKYKQIVDEVDRWTPERESLVLVPEAITQLPKQGKERQMNLWLPLSIAASALLMLATTVWFFTTSDHTEYTADSGETKEILLPDGKSTLILASTATVKWTEESWSARERALTLEGKGFLQVEKGSPFTVNTPNGTVEVLGTSFEVHAFENALQVTCYQGKVKATAVDQQSVIVNGGEGHLYYQGQWEAKTEVSGDKPQWLSSESSFNNAPLSQVIKTLEAEYDLKIDTGKINMDRRFTGSFPNDKLETALKIIFEPLNITYELKTDWLYLSE